MNYCCQIPVDPGEGEREKNLLVCYMNETASDEESEHATGDDCHSVEKLSKALVLGNISKKKGHVIIPLGQTGGRASGTVEGLFERSSKVRDDSELLVHVEAIQSEARQRLQEAKAEAEREVELSKRERRVCDARAAELLGLQPYKKMNRRILTNMNIAQIQILLNNFLSQIENLNENLVQFLMLRDELVMEQDALLTDIEDITNYINIS